ncbi:FAD/NAD(P)-binding protein [Candidatus Dependentiae bacterium]|nr:FAD/NAD(P)-binding protein [Candidatus Dependentiae bacterium]
MKNVYIPIEMEVEKNYFETSDRMIKTLKLKFIDEKFEFQPGQFCEFSILGKGEAPFGIASSPHVKDSIEFSINRAGVVTKAIHELRVGDIVGMRGPLGNYYPVDDMKGHNVVVIGGGFAFTTLRSLIEYMLHEKYRADYKDIKVIYGARNPGLLLYKDLLDNWEKRDDIETYFTIDQAVEGWEKLVGFVPTVTEQVAPSPENCYAIVCGPPIMIKFTLPVLLKLGFPKDKIITSLERRMKCGIGKCGRCNLGEHYICKDGPVFNFSQIEKLPNEV